MCKNSVYFSAPSLSATAPHFSCSGNSTDGNTVRSLFKLKPTSGVKPVCGRVNRVSANKTVNRVRFPVGLSLRLVFTTLSCLTFSNEIKQYEASTRCGRQVGSWQLESKVLLLLFGQANL